jgi:hypothetical protein
MSTESELFLAGRLDVAKEIFDIINREEQAYRDGSYRYYEDSKSNALLYIQERCKSILKLNKNNDEKV